MKRKITAFLIVLFIVTSPLGLKVRADSDLQLNAEAYVLVDPASGRVLEYKNADEKRPMASTTKIMTAILALEKGSLSSIVRVSPKAASMGGSSFWLKSGEKISLDNMLYGLLLPSGNDAATAIAEHVGKTQDDFVAMMNEKAVELGALNTHFANPHGLDEPNHYTTAKDLAKIAQYAWKFEQFREIVQTKTKDVNEGNYPRQISNTNRLLWGLEGTDGIKTGYTGKAGRCLVATTNKNDFRLLSVVLGSDDHFSDSSILLNFGFKNYKPELMVEKQKAYTDIPVYNGILNEVSLTAQESIVLPLKDDEDWSLEFAVPSKIDAPIVKGQPVGQIHVYIKNEYVISTSLTASKDIRQKTLKDIYEKLLMEWLRAGQKKTYKNLSKKV